MAVPETVFYDPDSTYGGCVDAIGPDGLGLYGKRTVADMQAEHPRGYVCTLDHAARMGELRATRPVVEITRDDFWYFLEVLPPCGWVRGHDVESFYMSEFESGRVTAHIVRLGERYYRATMPVCKHAARVFAVECAIAEARAIEYPNRLEA